MEFHIVLGLSKTPLCSGQQVVLGIKALANENKDLNFILKLTWCKEGTDFVFKSGLHARQWWHKPLISALRRQWQANL